jgi:hypothetical protein
LRAARSFALASLTLDAAHANRQDPDGIFPAAQGFRKAEAEAQQAFGALVNAIKDAERDQ